MSLSIEEIACPDEGLRLYLCRFSGNFSEQDPVFSSLAVPEQLKHPEKIKEYLASRLLASRYLPGGIQGLQFTEKGKPYCQGFRGISLSHTLERVCLLTSDFWDCGTDIEPVSEKAHRIGRKFILEEERKLVDALFKKNSGATLVWSFKESCYKLYGERGLDYLKDIRLVGVNEADERLWGYYKSPGGQVWVSGFFRFFEGRVLVYVIPQDK